MAGKPIPVRLSDETIARLDRAAAKLGLDNRTDLIKLAINSLLRHIERSGRLQLPVDWRDLLDDMDGRTHRYASLRVAETDTEGYEA